jgi:hypothetical protein
MFLLLLVCAIVIICLFSTLLCVDQGEHRRREAIEISAQMEHAMRSLQEVADNLKQIEALRSKALSHSDMSGSSDGSIASPILLFLKNPKHTGMPADELRVPVLAERNNIAKYLQSLRPGFRAKPGDRFDAGILSRKMRYPPDLLWLELENPVVIHGWFYVDKTPLCIGLTEVFSSIYGDKQLLFPGSNRSDPSSITNLFSIRPKLIDIKTVRSVVVLEANSLKVGEYTSGGGAYAVTIHACVLSYPDFTVIAKRSFVGNPPSSVYTPVGIPRGAAGGNEAREALYKWLSRNAEIPCRSWPTHWPPSG